MRNEMSESTTNHQTSREPAQWPAGCAPVAVIMISLNEGHNMEAVLANLRGWASEVFLVDSFSSDDTVDIALRHGVTVVQRRFRGFGDQWNFALRELPVTAPWTMKLDPDERLTDELKASIASTVQGEDRSVAIAMHRRLWFMGKALPVRQPLTRVWRTGRCRFSDVLVNEHPHVEDKLLFVKGDLEHHDSPDLHHWMAKQNKYSTSEAITRFEGRDLAATPDLTGNALQRRMWIKRNFWKVPGRYVLLFWYHLLVQGAWRAGRVGWIWARLRTSVYRLSEFKEYEMHQKGHVPAKTANGIGSPDVRVTQYE